MAPTERALSEQVGLILISFLIVIVTLFIIASVTGIITSLLAKPALLSVQAYPYNTSTGSQLIILYHGQGEAVNLNGTSQKEGVSTISLFLSTPSGTIVQVRNSTFLQKNAWRAGDTLYVYGNNGSYWFSDGIPSGGVDLPQGSWKLTIIDDTVKVLLHTFVIEIT